MRRLNESFKNDILTTTFCTNNFTLIDIKTTAMNKLHGCCFIIEVVWFLFYFSSQTEITLFVTPESV